MKRIVPLAAVACAAATASCGGDWDQKSQPVRSDGQARKLVQRTFTDVQDRNLDDLELLLAPDFTLQRTTGPAIDRATYLAHLPDLRGYRLGPVHGTAYGSTMTASFTASTRLVADGRWFSKAPSAYLASFSRDGKGKWHIVSIANFTKPLQ